MCLIVLEMLNCMTLGIIEFPLAGTIGILGCSIFTCIVLIYISNKIKMDGRLGIIEWWEKIRYIFICFIVVLLVG